MLATKSGRWKMSVRAEVLGGGRRDGQFSSVQSLSRVQLCGPMNDSTPGLPVHHQLPESTQTHVHQVDDAIQPSHPLLFLCPPASIFPSIRVFSNELALRIKWPKKTCHISKNSMRSVLTNPLPSRNLHYNNQ